MFRKIPRSVVEESWAAWRASQKEKGKACATGPEAGVTEQVSEHARLFTEEDLRPPAAPRKRAPPDGVCFF